MAAFLVSTPSPRSSEVPALPSGPGAHLMAWPRPCFTRGSGVCRISSINGRLYVKFSQHHLTDAQPP